MEETKRVYSIRIEDSLLNKIKESAKINDRSVNAEMRVLIKRGMSIKK